MPFFWAFSLLKLSAFCLERELEHAWQPGVHHWFFHHSKTVNCDFYPQLILERVENVLWLVSFEWMYIFFSVLRKKTVIKIWTPILNHFFVAGLLGKLECPCSSWMDVLLCISFLECAPASPSCIFPEEIIWSVLALPFCISSAFIAFSFLMTFAQCSISNMFQHRNHDDFATVAGVVVLLDSFYLCFMLNFYVICKVEAHLHFQIVFMPGVFKCLKWVFMCCFVFNILVSQGLLSFIWKMNEMLSMQLEGLIEQNLVEKDAGFVLSGLR